MLSIQQHSYRMTNTFSMGYPFDTTYDPKKKTNLTTARLSPISNKIVSFHVTSDVRMRYRFDFFGRFRFIKIRCQSRYDLSLNRQTTCGANFETSVNIGFDVIERTDQLFVTVNERD